jgi:hypothetical protein
MTGKDREYDRMYDRRGVGETRNSWVVVFESSVYLARGDMHCHLTKSGHAFYVVDPNHLFVRGVPFRHNYTQSSAGLP